MLRVFGAAGAEESDNSKFINGLLAYGPRYATSQSNWSAVVGNRPSVAFKVSLGLPFLGSIDFYKSPGFVDHRRDVGSNFNLYFATRQNFLGISINDQGRVVAHFASRDKGWLPSGARSYDPVTLKGLPAERGILSAVFGEGEAFSGDAFKAKEVTLTTAQLRAGIEHVKSGLSKDVLKYERVLKGLQDRIEKHPLVAELNSRGRGDLGTEEMALAAGGAMIGADDQDDPDDDYNPHPKVIRKILLPSDDGPRLLSEIDDLSEVYDMQQALSGRVEDEDDLSSLVVLLEKFVSSRKEYEKALDAQDRGQMKWLSALESDMKRLTGLINSGQLDGQEMQLLQAFKERPNYEVRTGAHARMA